MTTTIPPRRSSPTRRSGAETDQRIALPAGLLRDIVCGIADAPPLWRPHASHDCDGRRPVRLLAESLYEVWVIGWAPGQGVELHDHGDARGVLVVVEGELVELALAGRTLERTRLGPRRAHPLPIGLVHDVVNPGPALATSIHVYSPPLVAMTHYDRTTLRPSYTEPVAGEAPSLSVGDVARHRHPGRHDG